MNIQGWNAIKIDTITKPDSIQNRCFSRLPDWDTHTIIKLCRAEAFLSEIPLKHFFKAISHERLLLILNPRYLIIHPAYVLYIFYTCVYRIFILICFVPRFSPFDRPTAD